MGQNELLNLEKNYPLNSQECALIAISTPIVSLYKLIGLTGGHNVVFKGNVINTAQDMSNLCHTLPRLSKNINYFTVRSIRRNEPGQYKDFIVRRERISLWFHFLVKWKPAYRNAVISADNLDLLPLNDSNFAN